ncbi:hypothetical protein EJ06DRAFT_557747 [Trichodelitschia bisporula]|uniref:BZIP domain-containing protein n=1 Tax=Trichodelitschia bisporula TaxID=703511 RepID=A0A6G1HTW8_9PEZI|nr:hypothetical protein EJ06DRAFT_557747 [Trichodelitschia bisporula]
MRRAQRNFQQRRATAIATLEMRVRELESTVEAMSTEFVAFGDRLLESSALAASQHAQVLQDLRDTTHRFLTLARAADPDPDAEPSHSQDVSSSSDDGGQGASEQSVQSPSVGLDPLSGFTASFSVGVPAYATVYPTVPASAPAGQFSPRLNYMLSPDPSSDQVFPMEYLIGSPESFPTRLFFDTIQEARSCLLGEVYAPGFIPSACRYRLFQESVTLVVEAIRQQLESMTINQSESLHLDPRLEEGGTNLYSRNEYRRLHPMLVQNAADIARQGGALSEWLDPWHAYQRLRQVWGLRLTSSAVLVPTHVRRAYLPGGAQFSATFGLPPPPQHEIGLEQPDTLINPQILIRRLNRTAMCLGDGPRFLTREVDEAAHWLLTEVVI